jgi:hypothetical protein
MGSSISVSERFLIDDSDMEEMLLDNDDIEHTMVIVAVKNLQERLRMKRWHR